MMEQEAVLTVPEAAEWLRVSKNTIYRAIRSGQLPAIRISESIRIPTSAVQTLLIGKRGGEDDRPHTATAESPITGR